MQRHPSASRFLLAWLLAATIAVALSAGSLAAGPSRTFVTYAGAAATFECNVASGVPTGDCNSRLGGDRILGDGGQYVGDPQYPTSGAFLVTTTGGGFNLDDFQLKLDPSGSRFVWLDFGIVSKPGTCGKNRMPACRKNFDSMVVTSTQLAQGTLVRPVTSCTVDATELAGGLEALSQNTPQPARLLLNFPANGYWFTVRFNPTDYPGSSCVYVTRTGTDSWEIQAGGNVADPDTAIAELVASPTGSTKGQTNEGYFLMPFKITVTKN